MMVSANSQVVASLRYELVQWHVVFHVLRYLVATNLQFGVLAHLLLADQRILVFRLGFEDDEREACLVEQQEVDEPIACLLEVLA
jgi:hypothetical protein